MRRLSLAVTFLACLNAGCWFKKKTPPAVFQTPPPQPVQKPAPIPPPPAVETQAGQLPPNAPAINVPAAQPPPAEPSKPKPPRRTRRPVTASKPRPQPAEPPQSPSDPPPQLGVLMSAEEREQLMAEYESRKKRAQSVLTSMTTRRLSSAQQETEQRVRAFVGQAEERVSKDLATAVQLIRRADLLADELAKSFP